MSARYGLPGYYAGATAARTGDEMVSPAVLLLGVATTGSVAEASVLLTAMTAAAALGGPALGSMLDRSRCPGRTLALALCGYAVGLALIAAGMGRLPVPLLAVVAAASGLCVPAVAGGWTAQLSRVVDGGRLERASAGDAVTFGTAGLAGPLLAGVLAAGAGARTAVLAALALVLVAALAAGSLPQGAAGRTSRRPTLREVASGVTAIVANPVLRAATIGSAISYAGVGMLIVATPLLGAAHFGDPALGTLLLAVLAASGLLAGAVLTRWPTTRPETMFLVSVATLGAAMALAGLASGPIAVLAAAALAGLGDGPQLTALFALRHREAPAGSRARVFTTAASIKIGGLATGTALGGLIAGPSLTACLLIAAALQAVAALTYLGLRALPARRPSPVRAA